MQPYTYTGAVKCDSGFDTSNVKGKTAVITGGANGMGEAYVRNLVAAGAFVVFGDIDEECGKQVEADLKGAAQFVKCDVTRWKDQLAMFKQALANSPNKRVDIAVANAGITATDEVFFQNPDHEDPEEPNLRIMNINGIGALYTVKLALHYFHRQYAADKEASKDQVLILQGSLAGYLDLKGAIQYGFTKFGLRSVMRNLRQTEHDHGTRVNYIGPWFVKTKILAPAAVKHLTQAGHEFASVEDAATTLFVFLQDWTRLTRVYRDVSRLTTTGMKIVSDPSVNGRAFAVVPRRQSETGYVDIDIDDYKEGGLMRELNDALIGTTHRSTKPSS